MDFATYARELCRLRPASESAWIAVESVDSTNRLGRRVAAEYQREGDAVPAAVLFAWQQTGGRGRGENRWSSPPGQGIYATLLRTLGEASELQHLPLRVAVALAEALNRRLGGRCRLKWPNDLRVEGRKLGGILIESSLRTGEDPVAVIGFGINLRGLPEAPGATSLENESAGLDSLPALAAELAMAVAAGVAAEEVPVGRYAELSEHRTGDELECRVAEEIFRGRFLSFDEHGHLRLEVGGEERRIAAGEVFSHG